MRSRAAVWVNFAFAIVVVLGVFVEVYLIAAWQSGAGDAALDAHEFIGNNVVQTAELLVFLSALAGFWGVWRWVGWSAALLALGVIQILLAPGDDPSNGWVHGLHGLLALVVFVVASVIVHHDMRLLRQRALPPAP